MGSRRDVIGTMREGVGLLALEEPIGADLSADIIDLDGDEFQDDGNVGYFHNFLPNDIDLSRTTVSDEGERNSAATQTRSKKSEKKSKEIIEIDLEDSPLSIAETQEPQCSTARRKETSLSRKKRRRKCSAPRRLPASTRDCVIIDLNEDDDTFSKRNRTVPFPRCTKKPCKVDKKEEPCLRDETVSSRRLEKNRSSSRIEKSKKTANQIRSTSAACITSTHPGKSDPDQYELTRKRLRLNEDFSHPDDDGTNYANANLSKHGASAHWATAPKANEHPAISHSQGANGECLARRGLGGRTSMAGTPRADIVTRISSAPQQNTSAAEGVGQASTPAPKYDEWAGIAEEGVSQKPDERLVGREPAASSPNFIVIDDDDGDNETSRIGDTVSTAWPTKLVKATQSHDAEPVANGQPLATAARKGSSCRLEQNAVVVPTRPEVANGQATSAPMSVGNATKVRQRPPTSSAKAGVPARADDQQSSSAAELVANEQEASQDNPPAGQQTQSSSLTVGATLVAEDSKSSDTSEEVTRGMNDDESAGVSQQDPGPLAEGPNFIIIDDNDVAEHHGGNAYSGEEYAYQSFFSNQREALLPLGLGGRHRRTGVTQRKPSTQCWQQDKKTFCRKRDYNFVMSGEDARNEQERLFRQAACKLSEWQDSQQQQQQEATTSTTDVFKMNPNHWKWPDLRARLGVTHHATRSQVRSQYRKLARLYHPDKCRLRDSSQRFQAITEAYQKLMGSY